MRGYSAGIVMILLIVSTFQVWAQGIQTSPYSAPSVLGSGLGRGASQSLTSDTVSLSSDLFPSILPPIPNLQFGYIYSFGQTVRSGRFTVDYLRPVSVGENSAVFCEAHAEFQGFWNSVGFNNRTDISLGGGYRTIKRNSTLLGVNGFYDTTHLGSSWYSSGSLGVEFAVLLPGNDALDFNFNWYGQLFDSTVIRNAFRYGPNNFDLEAGYSHELWQGGPDLRLKITGYQFDVGRLIGGWNAGAELKTRDGALSLKYEVGNDRINQTYHTVAGFVNVGFRPENIFSGKNPLEMPEPIFKSPRNLMRMLAQSVKRDWHQPAAVVQAQAIGVSAASNAGTTYTLTLPGTQGTGTWWNFWIFTTVPDVTAINLSGPLPTFTIRWTGLDSDVNVNSVTLLSENPGGAAGRLRFENVSSTFVMNAGSGTYTGTFTGSGEATEDLQLVPDRLFLGTTDTFSFTGGSLTITLSQ